MEKGKFVFAGIFYANFISMNQKKNVFLHIFQAGAWCITPYGTTNGFSAENAVQFVEYLQKQTNTRVVTKKGKMPNERIDRKTAQHS